MFRFIFMLIVLGAIFVLFLCLWSSLQQKEAEEHNVFDTTPEELAKTEHRLALEKIGAVEHELGLLPHNDSNVIAVCTVCIAERERKQEEWDRKEAADWRKAELTRALENAPRDSFTIVGEGLSVEIPRATINEGNKAIEDVIVKRTQLYVVNVAERDKR